MKQIIICYLALASVSASHHGGYAPYFGHGSPGLIDLGEHLDLKHEIKPEYPAGLLFGYGYVSGLHHEKGLEEEHHAIEGYAGTHEEIVHTINTQHYPNSFEENLVAPELPKIQPHITTSIASPRYTNTPTDTYEVREDNFEPVPVPKITSPITPLRVLSSNKDQQAPISLGSGSLGVVDLGNGKFSIGSGTLGYGQQIATGGLTEVPAPVFGSADFNIQPEAFPAAAPLDFNSLQGTSFDFSKA